MQSVDSSLFYRSSHASIEEEEEEDEPVAKMIGITDERRLHSQGQYR
jgi:hypothetical protein